MTVVKAENAQPENGPHVLVVQGEVAPTWYWVEVRVEATPMAFERETGEAIAHGALAALGEACREAWRKDRAT